MRCLESRQNDRVIPELLSPAGSYDTAVAVINAGADAVYLGGELYSARAYAENLTTERLLRVLDYAHLKDRRVYITINTLLKNNELEETLYDYFLPLYEGGVDGVIVQDMGVVDFLSAEFPGVPLHISTQVGVSTLEGVRFFEHRGIKRIVLSRELSLNDISYIHDNSNMELEVFGHGALCYSYSGKCLISGMIGGRSANRGRCAGACRLPFSVLGDIKEEERYPLSLKDLSTLHLIPQLSKAGVASLKIEGRMKQTRYAAGVTAVYRKYLDIYRERGDERFKVSDEDANLILELGNRNGFTDGYLTGKRENMVSMSSGSHIRGKAEEGRESGDGTQKAQEPDVTYEAEELKEPVDARLVLRRDVPARLMLEWNDIRVEVEGSAPSAAKKLPMEMEDVRKKISSSGDSLFYFRSLETEMDDDIFLPVSAVKGIRRDALAKLRTIALTDFLRKKSKGEPGEEPAEEKTDGSVPDSRPMSRAVYAGNEKSDIGISVSVLSRDQLISVLEHSPDRVIMDFFLYETLLFDNDPDILKMLDAYSSSSDKTLAVRLPGIFDRGIVDRVKSVVQKNALDILFVCDSFDAVGMLEECEIPLNRVIAGDGMYSFSDRAGKYFLRQGVAELTAPYEISKKELFCRDNSDTTIPVYGAIPVMYSAQCVLKNSGICIAGKEPAVKRLRLKGQGYLINELLTDRKKRSLPLICGCECGCTNVYYNPDKLFLLHCMREIMPLGARYIRLDMTDETPEQCDDIITAAKKAMAGEKILPEEHTKFFTKGHFKRGV